LKSLRYFRESSVARRKRLKFPAIRPFSRGSISLISRRFSVATNCGTSFREIGDSDMRLLFSAKLRLVVVSASMLLLPLQQLLAANPQVLANASQPAAVPTAVIRDVALQAGGTMRGQVVDAQGNPCGQVPLRVIRTTDQAAVVTAQTDAQGRFAVSGLTGGVYRVETPVGAAVYRLWAPNAAPPSAIASALVVQGDPAVRGNLGGLGWFGWTLIGLGVAAAIALPLALDDDDDAS